MGYSSRGQVANRTGYLIQLLIPSFIREIRYGSNINRLLVDSERHMLYCLYKRNSIYGYYLGPTSFISLDGTLSIDRDFEYAFEVSDISETLRRYCQCNSRPSCSRLLNVLNTRTESKHVCSSSSLHSSYSCCQLMSSLHRLPKRCVLLE